MGGGVVGGNDVHYGSGGVGLAIIVGYRNVEVGDVGFEGCVMAVVS